MATTSVVNERTMENLSLSFESLLNVVPKHLEYGWDFLSGASDTYGASIFGSNVSNRLGPPGEEENHRFVLNNSSSIAHSILSAKQIRGETLSANPPTPSMLRRFRFGVVKSVLLTC